MLKNTIIFFATVISIILVFLFFLFKGISVNSFSFGNIYISSLYLKLDKKLIVKIDELKINKTSQSKTSLDSIAKTISYIPKVLSYFQEIDLKSLKINNNEFLIHFSKNKILLDNKFIRLSAKPRFLGNSILLSLDELYLKDYKLFLQGTLKINTQDQTLDLVSAFKYDKIEGNVSVEANQNDIKILLSTKEMDDIKFLKRLFRIDDVAEAWMYDNIKGKITLNNLFVKLDAKTFMPDEKSIKGDLSIKNAKVMFHKNLPKAKSKKIDIVFSKGDLHIYLNKATYLDKKIYGSSVIIENLTNKKGLVKVNIKANTLLDKDILNITKAFNVNIPIIQTSGLTKADVTINVSYDAKIPIDIQGVFEIHDAKMNLQGFKFFAKKALVLLDNHILKIQDAQVKVDSLLEAQLNLDINLRKLSASGNTVLKYLKIQGEEKDLLSLKNKKSSITVDFKNKTKISFRELKTDIILNKRTHILLHDLSLFKNDSALLKDLNIKAGNLSLYMKNEKDINFEAFLKGIDLPLINEGEKIKDLTVKGRYKNDDLSLSALKNKIKIFQKNKQTMEISLKDMDFLIYGQNGNNPSNIDFFLDNINLYINKDSFYNLNTMNVFLKKDKILFTGLVSNLDIPLFNKGKKIVNLEIQGEYANNDFSFITKDKTIKLKILDNDNMFLDIKNLDVYYDDKKNNKSIFTSITLKAENSNILLGNNKKVLSKRFKILQKEEEFTFNSYYEKSSIYYKKSKNNKVIVKAINLNDTFINAFLDKDIVKGGIFDISASGTPSQLKGHATIQNTSIKNMAAINNLIILVNASPGLINPLLAIPSVLELVTQKGFDVQGYKIVEGDIDFTYDINKEVLNMTKVFTKGNSVDFDGEVRMDFKKDEIKGEMDVIFMKSYSLLIKHIPLINYIFLGDEKRVDTRVSLKGKISDPIIDSNLAQNSLAAPFNVIKRIITLPLKAVEMFIPEDKEKKK
ncbi:MAG: AsmA-like C-terminal domain-containing protein [Campylobacteraceae bacterium]|nr:AsmA-like C-terminal domain-containing protein [Campylobacteraceae bacterium]